MAATHTLIVSDTHIGSAVAASADLLKVLQSNSFQRLILLGDIFDGPHVKKLNSGDQALLACWQKLIDSGVEVVWIRGNHDRVLNKILQRFKGIEFIEEFRWQEGDKIFCAIHGHQFDGLSPSDSLWGRISTKFHSLFAQAIRHKKTVTILDKLHSSTRQLTRKIADGALAYAEKEGIDVIICGHSHEAVSKTLLPTSGKEIHYFNTGSWIREPYSYITVHEGKVSIEMVP